VIYVIVGTISHQSSNCD